MKNAKGETDNEAKKEITEEIRELEEIVIKLNSLNDVEFELYLMELYGEE